MIEFQKIDDFKPPKTEEYVFVSQRYLHKEMDALRSERTEDLDQKFESNLTPTTLPTFPSIEIKQLHQTRDQLLEQRSKLLGTLFLSLRPNKIKQIKIIDRELDRVEREIISLERTDQEKEMTSIEKFISENEKRIQKYKTDIKLT